jgi:hypothetical protein
MKDKIKSEQVDSDSEIDENVRQQLQYDDVAQLESEPVAAFEEVAAVAAVEDALPRMENAVVHPHTCTAVLKSGIHKGDLCGKKVQQGMTLCLQHNK